MVNTYILLLVVLNSFLLPTLTAANFSQESLKKNALSFGNKTDNLMELEKITKDIKLSSGYSVQVPVFFGISNDEIQTYLTTQLEDELQKLWQEFKKIQGEKSTLDVNAAQILEHMRQKITSAFTDFEKSPLIKDENKLKLFEKFLSNAQEQKKLLMVRSTRAAVDIKKDQYTNLCKSIYKKIDSKLRDKLKKNVYQNYEIQLTD